MGLGFGLAVGDQRDDEDQPQSADRKQNPAAPRKTASVLGFDVGDSLCDHMLAAAFWTNHFTHPLKPSGSPGGYFYYTDFLESSHALW